MYHNFIILILKVRDNVDNFYDDWYEEARQLAQSVNVAEEMPRIASRQTQRANPPCPNAKAYYKTTVLIPFLDHVLSEMSERYPANVNLFCMLQCYN